MRRSRSLGRPTASTATAPTSASTKQTGRYPGQPGNFLIVAVGEHVGGWMLARAVRPPGEYHDARAAEAARSLVERALVRLGYGVDTGSAGVGGRPRRGSSTAESRGQADTPGTGTQQIRPPRVLARRPHPGWAMAALASSPPVPAPSPAELAPLTDDEAGLLYHVGRFGADGYPVERVGRHWHWRDWRSVRGAPVSYRTRKLAVGAFEGWVDLALARWRAQRAACPGAILTAVGVLVPGSRS